MTHFLDELKRRNVFRVAIAYGVVSWIIVQVVDTVAGPLDLPEWTPTLVIVLLLIGLPVALLFAWAFELTPEGVKRSDEVEIDESVTAFTAKKLNVGIIGLLVIAILVMVWERQSLVEKIDQGVATASTDGETVTSIAVLPFVSMASDPEQAYFSDGISEELLNVLAKIPEFRVAARTSSFQFKGENRDITDIAKQLNVEHVLEGSVRRSGDQIRITAQLIEASSGFHLWSNAYDSAFVDVFKIQDEISKAIVDELSSTLGIKTIALPHQGRAVNPDAFAALMQGQELIRKRTAADIELSIGHFNRALEIDPDYAAAHAQLGLAWYLLMGSRSTYGDLRRDMAVPLARTSVLRALELDPDLPEALGLSALIDDEEGLLDVALEKFERALKINPSLTEVRNWYSVTLDDVGRFDESREQLRLAYELDPLSRLTLSNYARDLIRAKKYDTVQPLIERMGSIDATEALALEASILRDRGELAEAALKHRQAVELSPREGRVNSRFAFSLYDLGLMEEAQDAWISTSGRGFFIGLTGDPERGLEIDLARVATAIDKASIYDDIALHYWDLGNLGEAVRYANLSLDGRSQDGYEVRTIIKLILATQTLIDGSEQSASPLFAEIERALTEEIRELGEFRWLLWSKGLSVVAQGRRAEGIDILAQAIQTSPVWNLRRESLLFRHLGLDKEARLLELKSKVLEERDAERLKFLQTVCGDSAETAWSPSTETCRSIST